MDMSANMLNLFEAIVKFGANPDKDNALAVTRTIETALHHSQKHSEKQILDVVMTKEDGQRLKGDVRLLKWMLGTTLAGIGAIIVLLLQQMLKT